MRYPRRPRLRAAAASNASDAAAIVTATCAAGATSTSRSRPPGAKSPAIGAHAWRAPAAAHLDLDGRVLPDTPARERRLTLELFATVVQLEVVRREPGAVAEGLVQEGSRQWFRAWDGWQARLHRLTNTGPGPALLAALAARLRRQPVGFAVDTAGGRGERMAAPGRK
eukprot:scaffold26169_cov66-Phaeocystis_antarctica.AAC.3